MAADVEIRAMRIADYDETAALWRASEGVGFSDADSRAGIGRYLERNCGLSFVACEGGRIVGAVLCGTDGRRGYLHHLAVAAAQRRCGVGAALARRCLSALRERGINKCHLFVFARNRQALAFWQRIGWTERVDLKVFSCETGR